MSSIVPLLLCSRMYFGGRLGQVSIVRYRLDYDSWVYGLFVTPSAVPILLSTASCKFFFGCSTWPHYQFFREWAGLAVSQSGCSDDSDSWLSY